MRILQLTKWLSRRADTGGKLRAYGLGLALSRFAEVDIAGFGDGDASAELKNAPRLSHYRNLYPVAMEGGWRRGAVVAAGLARGQALRSVRFASDVFQRRVAEILSAHSYDAVQVEELAMMINLPSLPEAVAVIYSAHNVESALSPQILRARRDGWHVIAPLEARRTRAEEVGALARTRFCLTVSDEDKRALERIDPSAASRIHVVPSCVFDDVKPGPGVTPAAGDSAEIVTIGSLRWPPNVEGARWFIAEVLPVLRQRSRCTVRFVGSGIAPELAGELAAAGCAVSADVDDVLPYLHRARLAFVPLHTGGGTRLKIVEAWAAGVPVVSTPLGAEGLGAVDGVDLLLAADAQGFSGALLRALENDELWNRLRDNGLRRASTLRWSEQGVRLQGLYSALLDRAGR